jgi:hypothetical protein
MLFRKSPQAVRQPRKPKGRAARPKNYPPQLVLERLEDRTVPSILFGDASTMSTNSGAGHVIKAAQVELIFWGADWNAANEAPVQGAVGSILNSHYMDSLKQYGGIQKGTLDHSYSFTGTSPAATFTNDNVQEMLKSHFKDGSLPAPKDDKSNLLYMVIPQSGSTAVEGGSADIGGKHDTGAYGTLAGTVHYHYGWTINENGNLDALTYYFSHELAEAVTDPDYHSYQFAPGNAVNEISDNEAQNYAYRLDGVLVQSYWSDSDQRCVVPTGQNQNFYVNMKRELTVKGDQLKDAGGHVTPNDTVSVEDSADSDRIKVTLNDEVAEFDRKYFPWQPDGKQKQNITKITVEPKTGSNTVNIEATTDKVPVTIQGATGTDTIQVSATAQKLDNIHGKITLKGGSDTNTITLFDQNEAAVSRTFTIQSTSVKRDGTDVITFDNKTTNLEVNGSNSVGTTFDVVSTGAKTKVALNGHTGRDVFNLSPTDKNLDKLLGEVTVDGGSSGGNELNVHDETNGRTGATWTVTDSTLQRTGGGSAKVTYRNVTYLNISGTKANAVYNVESTASGTTTTITAAAGSDTFNVAPTSKNLDGIKGKLAFDGDGKDNYALNLYDQSSLDLEVYKLTRSTVDRVNIMNTVSVSIVYTHVTSLELNGSLLAPTIWHIHGTEEATPVTIKGGASLNMIDLTPDLYDLAAIHSVTVKNVSKGIPYIVTFVNSNSPMHYMVDDTKVVIPELPSFHLTFENVGELNVINYFTNTVFNGSSSILVKQNGLAIDPGSFHVWEG